MALPSYALRPRDLLLGVAPPDSAPAVVPPDVASFVQAKFSPTNGDPSRAPTSAEAIDDALAQDRKAQGTAALAQNLSRAAALYRGDRVGAPSVPPLDDAVKAYAMKRQAEQQDTDLAEKKRKQQWEIEDRPDVVAQRKATTTATQNRATQEAAATRKVTADVDEAERQRTALNDSTSLDSKVLRDLAKKYGSLDLPENTAGSSVLRVLPVLEKAYAAQMAASAARNRLEITSGDRSDKRSDSLAEKLSKELDPYAAKGGLKGSADIVNRAKRLKALIIDDNGQPKNLDRRQIEEVAIGLNSLLSGSNAGAQHQVESLVPQSIWGDVKKLQERITNEPTGLDQVKFVDRLLETIKREEGVTQKTIRDAVKARIPAYSSLRDLDLPRYESILRARGLDPELLDEHGLEKPGQANADPLGIR